MEAPRDFCFRKNLKLLKLSLWSLVHLSFVGVHSLFWISSMLYARSAVLFQKNLFSPPNGCITSTVYWTQSFMRVWTKNSDQRSRSCLPIVVSSSQEYIVKIWFWRGRFIKRGILSVQRGEVLWKEQIQEKKAVHFDRAHLTKRSMGTVLVKSHVLSKLVNCVNVPWIKTQWKTWNNLSPVSVSRKRDSSIQSVLAIQKVLEWFGLQRLRTKESGVRMDGLAKSRNLLTNCCQLSW